MTVEVVVFSVAAGDRNDSAGTEAEKQLHLTGDERTVRCGLCKCTGVKTRRAENDIRLQILKVILAELPCHASSFQCIRHLAQICAAAFITYRNTVSRLKQQVDQRQIAHAGANDGTAFIPQTAHIFRNTQMYSLPSGNCGFV